ncbi:T9SS type A sorting domain-containing protein [Cryomorphaceae bacterium 1068]|nr:T9SS type A sorting domain-containing protein [Cryomorphaceae bacterium 1068]
MKQHILLFTAIILTTSQLLAQNINLDLDLVGHYTFSNSGADSSGNNNLAFITGCEFTEDRLGSPQSALRFSGPGDYVLFPEMIQLYNPEWSYALWFKPEELASEKSDMFLLSYLNISTFDDVHLFLDDQNDQFSTYIESGSVKYTTGVTAVIDQWYHLTISYASDDSIKIYVDGELLIAQRENFSSLGDASIVLASIINNSTSLKGRIFGVVDDVRFYSREITPTEVEVLADFDSEIEEEEEEEIDDITESDSTFFSISPTFALNQDILIRSSETITELELYDASGKLISRSTEGGTTHRIGTKPLSQGMYIIVARMMGNIRSEKVMVVK